MPNPEDKQLNDAEKMQLVEDKAWLDAKKVQLEAEKIELEKIKIGLETENLKKSPYKQPTVFFPFLAVITSLIISLTNMLIVDRKKEALEGKAADAEQRFKNVQGRVTDAKKNISGLITNLKSHISPESEGILKDVLSTLNRIDSLSDTITFKTNIPVSEAAVSSRVETAKIDEYKGFQALANGDLESARAAFDRSEKTYPGYHISYELVRILTNPPSTKEDRKARLKIIVDKYLRWVPNDLKDDLKRAAGLPQ